MSTKTWIAVLALMLSINLSVSAADPPTTPLFVVHFETGPKWDRSLAPAEQPSFKEHSANLNRLRKEGTILFGARYEDVGMIVISASTVAAAKILIDADPGVRAGIFTYRIAALNVFYPWR